jgi:hypothetical protein
LEEEIEVGKLLGDGAFSIVWSGTLRGEKVAIKAIKMAMISKAEVVSRVSVVTHSRFPTSGRLLLAIVQRGNQLETFAAQKHRTPPRSFHQFKIFR